MFDADQAAARATSALSDDDVRTVVARKVVDEVLLDAEPDLLAARPLLEGLAKSIVGSDAFTGLFGFAVRDAHRASVVTCGSPGSSSR